MLLTEILFLSIELLIHLSSFSFFVFDVFETRLIVLFFFLSQTVFYILLLLSSIPLTLFGSAKILNRRR